MVMANLIYRITNKLKSNKTRKALAKAKNVTCGDNLYVNAGMKFYHS